MKIEFRLFDTYEECESANKSLRDAINFAQNDIGSTSLGLVFSVRKDGLIVLEDRTPLFVPDNVASRNLMIAKLQEIIEVLKNPYIHNEPERRENTSPVAFSEPLDVIKDPETF